MKKEAKGYLNVILAQIIFSFMYIFVRFVESFGTYNLSFWRVFLSAAFLFVFSLLYRRYKIISPKYERGKLLFFGAIHGFIILASFLSIYYLSLASAMFLQATLSIWMAVFSYFILKEKIDARVVIALLISFIGLAVLLSPFNLLAEKSIIGICSALFVGIFGGLVYVISKTFKKYDPLSLTFWQNLIAVPFLLPLLFIQKPVLGLFNISFVAIIALCGAFGFLFMFFGLKLGKGSYAGVLTLINFVLVILLGIVFFNEIPSLREIIGGCFILVGVYLVLTKK